MLYEHWYKLSVAISPHHLLFTRCTSLHCFASDGEGIQAVKNPALIIFKSSLQNDLAETGNPSDNELKL